MIEGLRLELRDVAPIARADLDINRINIVFIRIRDCVSIHMCLCL